MFIDFYEFKVEYVDLKVEFKWKHRVVILQLDKNVFMTQVDEVLINLDFLLRVTIWHFVLVSKLEFCNSFKI